MFAEPLVSIIVPVYNVKSYLRACLDSICCQNYKNLEIIIVNDGSTDGSQDICEEYAAKDNRIKLIVKENEGISSARNTGIREASADFIGFVDSDDIIHTSFVSAMMRALIESECKIVVCDYSTDADGMDNSSTDYSIMSNTEAISGLLDDWGYRCSVWDKMFRKECFENNMFPEGEIFEDIKLVYDLFEQTERIAYIKQPLYFYRTRRGSITKSPFSSGSYYLLYSLNYVLMKSGEIEDVDHNRVLFGYMSYYIGLFVRPEIINKPELSKEAQNLRATVKKNKRLLLKKQSFIKRTKVFELLIFAYAPILYRFLLFIWKKAVDI